ncbi:MAG: polysaccharide deacetylase family protein [Candidatus Omnitrophica bacterium]|nr:polysaccharide deacetylase family protein [Candidatus Omnitrophota bacterium]
MPKRKLLIAGTLIIFLAFTLSYNFVKRNYVFPILMYHSVSPQAQKANRLSITPEVFERQMLFLKKFGYNVVPLESLLSFIEEGKVVPARSVAITFDDGYRDNYTYAFPILKKYNLPATVFVIINEIGRPQQDRLSWQEVNQMRSSGLITFGSHCMGPEPLINLKSEEEVKRQIFDSKKALEDKLGEKIVLFSYPEGRFNERIKCLVREAGYKLAVTTSPGKRFSSRDIFALKRLRISSNAGNLFVFWVESSGIYTFIKEHRDAD